MARMRILVNGVEEEAFGLPPVFNSAQRKQYFEFSSAPPRWLSVCTNRRGCWICVQCYVALRTSVGMGPGSVNPAEAVARGATGMFNVDGTGSGQCTRHRGVGDACRTRNLSRSTVPARRLLHSVCDCFCG